MSPAWVGWGIVLYTFVALLVAFLSRSGKAQGMSDYFLSSRTMGGVLSALSYSATTYSAFMLVGLAGLTYKGGVGALGFEMIYLSGMVLVAFFGPRFWLVGRKFGYVTPSEMLGDRYESRAVSIVVAIASCLFLIPYTSVQLTGIGYLLQGMTNDAIPYTAGVMLATGLAIVFSLIAGMRSVAWTDALQALLMIVTATAVLLVVVHSFGGFAPLFAEISAEHPGWLTVPGNGFFNFATFLSLSLPWFFFSLSNPQVSQRLFMPGSLRSMRRMLLGFLCFGFIYTLVSILWGFSALVRFPELPTADLATPKLLASDIVPPVLGVVVMVGIMAAAISTIDSILLTLSSLVARDIYGNAKESADEGRQLRVGKIAIPLIAVLAYLFAQMKLNLIAVLSVSSSAGLLVIVPAIFGAFFWKRGTAAGVLASVTISGIFVIVLEVLKLKPLGLGSGIWGLLASVVLFVGVSLLTRPPQEKAERFIGYLEKELAKRRAL